MIPSVRPPVAGISSVSERTLVFALRDFPSRLNLARALLRVALEKGLGVTTLTTHRTFTSTEEQWVRNKKEDKSCYQTENDSASNYFHTASHIEALYSKILSRI